MEMSAAQPTALFLLPTNGHLQVLLKELTGVKLRHMDANWAYNVHQRYVVKAYFGCRPLS